MDNLPVPVPPQVLELAAGRKLEQLWHNESGGLTYSLGDGTVLKWNPRSSGVDLAAEIARLEWASEYVVVPYVIDHGETDDTQWMLTAQLPGENAVTDRHKADPAGTVALLGRGLRRLHDSLPVEDCPFTWSVQERTARARTDHANWRLPLSIAEAHERFASPPSIDQLVVCHGDACAPNTLIDADGVLVGYVDVGALGIADRWADLAIATWSTEWNYGPGWEQALLDAYGIEPDPERTLFYRALWDLT